MKKHIDLDEASIFEGGELVGAISGAWDQGDRSDWALPHFADPARHCLCRQVESEENPEGVLDIHFRLPDKVMEEFEKAVDERSAMRGKSLELAKLEVMREAGWGKQVPLIEEAKWNAMFIVMAHNHWPGVLAYVRTLERRLGIKPFEFEKPKAN